MFFCVGDSLVFRLPGFPQRRSLRDDGCRYTFGRLPQIDSGSFGFMSTHPATCGETRDDAAQHGTNANIEDLPNPSSHLPTADGGRQRKEHSKAGAVFSRCPGLTRARVRAQPVPAKGTHTHKQTEPSPNTFLLTKSCLFCFHWRYFRLYLRAPLQKSSGSPFVHASALLTRS